MLSYCKCVENKHEQKYLACFYFLTENGSSFRCLVPWTLIDLEQLNGSKPRMEQDFEPLRNFYLFLNLIQFTAAKKQGSHQIPPSAVSLSLTPSNFSVTSQKMHEEVPICFILSLLLSASFNCEVLYLSNQGSEKSCLFMVTGTRL